MATAGSKRRGAIAIAAIIAALVAVLVGAGVLVWSQQDTPEKAVQRYVEALAAGDGETAAAAVVAPDDDRFLNSDVLAVAKEIDGLISDVRVDGMTATYQWQGQTVEHTFTAIERDGTYEVSNGLVAIPGGQLPRGATIGGQAVGDLATVHVFPGSYPIASVSDWLAMTPSSVGAGAPGNTSAEVTAELTDDGAAAIRDLAGDAIAACAKVKELAPEGCPWAFTNPVNATVDPETLAWQVKSTTLKKAPFTVDGTVVTAPVAIELSVTAEATMKRHKAVVPYRAQSTVTRLLFVDVREAGPTVYWGEA